MTEEVRERATSQATQILTLVEHAELFHTPNQEAYAAVLVNDHYETWPVKSEAFKRWLRQQFYVCIGSVPTRQGLEDALATLEGKALFEGAEEPVFTRVAEHEGAIYYDLANDRWQAVEIRAGGWKVVDRPPVKFRRPNGMQAQVLPLPGGSVDLLRPFVNVASEADWVVTVAYLTASLRPTGPFPPLVISGEQGSAKSTTCRLLRLLLDPNTTPLRAEPRELRDLMVAATNSWVVGLDNISYVPDWLSDSLCRLSTGGGFSTRALYQNDEEVLFEAQRPVLLNGIEELVTRSDLLDRAITLSLPRIPDERRLPEAEFWRRFEAVRPLIVGALFTLVSEALSRLPFVQLEKLPRMADFALWGVAVEQAVGWRSGAFMAAYTGTRESANLAALEASPIFTPLLTVVERRRQWTGTATDLLTLLSVSAAQQEQQWRGWPKNPRALSGQLRRLAPNLRKGGIEVVVGERENSPDRRRLISLRWMDATDHHAQPSVSPTPAVLPMTEAPACPKCGEATVQYNSMTVLMDDGLEVERRWRCVNGHGDPFPLIGQEHVEAKPTWMRGDVACSGEGLWYCPGTLKQVTSTQREDQTGTCLWRCSVCSGLDLLPASVSVDPLAPEYVIPADQNRCPRCAEYGAPTNDMYGSRRWYLCRDCDVPYLGSARWTPLEDEPLAA